MSDEFFRKPDFLAITGSRLYGTFRTEEDIIVSDTDKRGFVVPPREYLLSVKNFEQADLPDEEDTVIYSLNKFFSMLIKGNMQILELLFVPQDKILASSSVSDAVLLNRDLFIGKQYFASIMGFSYSEWRKANGTRIEIEQKTKTQQGVVADMLNVFNRLSKESKDSIIELLYSGHEKKIVPHVHRMGEKRKKEITEYGYCVSSASHAIRLLIECKELMEDATITFPVKKHEFLRDIKVGKVSLQEATEAYEEAKLEAEQAHDNSRLPNKADQNKIWDLYLDLIQGNL